MLENLKYQYSSMYVKDWRNISNAERIFTLQGLLGELDSVDDVSRRGALESITYVALGNFGHITATPDHVHQIKRNTKFLWNHGALGPVYQLLTHLINKKVPEDLYEFEENEEPLSQKSSENQDQELMNALTILYFMLETNRNDNIFAKDVDALEPPILQFTIKTIGRLRWGISGNLPLRNMFLLFWKIMLCLFGDSRQMDRTKRYMRKKYKLSEKVDHNAVSASPLDYHAFRQDIVQRYPAYVPPSSNLPKSFSNNRSMSQYIEVPRPSHAQPSNVTLPAPVAHIATPAPSPPASPAIASGQKVRKSVFMTNQSYPFLHPTENSVPQSIIEASELFSERVHTTPEMVQLWNERDKFMQQERGWVGSNENEGFGKELTHEEIVLKRIEKVYTDTIPQLHSFVVVVLKFMLASISFTSTEGQSK